MAGKPAIQVTGAKELRAALKHMSADLRDLTKINKEAAEIVAETSRDLAPVLTGDLRDSTRATATKAKGIVAVGGRAVPYAGPIIFGWPRRNIAPNPFIYDAADKRKDDVVGLYEKRVAALVIRVGIETP